MLLGLLVFSGFQTASLAQPTLTSPRALWHPDGPVNAVLQVDSTAHIGGAFGYVGPLSGALGVATKVDATASPLPRLNGTVLTILEDGVGGLYVGGSFSEESTGLKNLIHLNPDRSVDEAFAPNPSDTVRELGRNGANLFVAGNFITIAGSGGQTRRYLTAIDPVTGKVNAWNAAPNGPVQAILVAPDGVYAGGTFSAIGGQTRSRLAKLSLETGAATSWNPGVSGGTPGVSALALDGTTLYVGGEFNIAGGKPRNRIAAINTTVDTNGGTDWNPNSNGRIAALVVSGGTVYACGAFTSIGGLSRTNLVGLNATSGQASSLSVLPNGAVEAIQLLDGELYLGGGFTTVNGQLRRGLARINTGTGSLADWAAPVSALSPTTTPSVYAIVPVGGQVVYGGSFLSSGGVNRSNLAAIDGSTGRATTWNPGANNQVYSLGAGGSMIYVGGAFTECGGSARSRLAAVDRTTGLATAFVANITATGVNGINTIIVDSDRVYAGGTFTAVNGTARNNLARVAAISGAIYAPFSPSPNSTVRALALDGVNLFAGGDFTTIGSSNRTCLAQVSGETGRSTAFNARVSSSGVVRGIAVQSGQLYVIGDFSSIGGFSRRKLAVISAVNGDASATWNPDIGVLDSVRTYALAVSSHAAYVGGNFLSAGGEFRNYLASVPFGSSGATLWNPGFTTAGSFEVRCLSYGANYLLAGGEFTTVGGVFQPYLVAFSLRPSVPASLTSLTATGSVKVTVFDGDGTGSQVALEASPDVSPAAWVPLQKGPVTGIGSVFEEAAPNGRPRRFFRAVAAP